MTWRTDEKFECPVCGRTKAQVAQVLIGIPWGAVMYLMSCRECYSHGPLCETPDDAIWRMRHEGLKNMMWETYEGRRK